MCDTRRSEVDNNSNWESHGEQSIGSQTLHRSISGKKSIASQNETIIPYCTRHNGKNQFQYGKLVSDNIILFQAVFDAIIVEIRTRVKQHHIFTIFFHPFALLLIPCIFSFRTGPNSYEFFLHQSKSFSSPSILLMFYMFLCKNPISD